MTAPNRDSVRRLLVSAGDERLQAFHLEVAAYANAIERRDHTVFYTVFDARAGELLRAAEWADVTVQEIEGAGDVETYREILTGADRLSWSAP